MTIEQRVAVLEDIFAKLRDYYILIYSGEEIDALLASAGVPIGITKEYDSVSAMNDDFSGTDVTRGQFVLILTTDTSSEDYGKVYLKGSANWVYVFTLTSLTAIKGPQGPAGKTGAKGADGADGKNFMVLGYYETLSALNAAVPSPGTGDTYGVGTEPPYAFYMYDPTISNWRYVGNLQGPAGPTGGEDNFVRYDAAQSLTDAQKRQARENIDAGSAADLAKKPDAQLIYTTLHVAKTGNDTTGDGSESKPYLTIQKALNSLPKLLLARADIVIHGGTYEEAVLVYGFSGPNSLTIGGAENETVKIKTVDIRAVNLAEAVQLRNVEVTGTSDDGYNWSIYTSDCTDVSLENVTCTNTVPSSYVGAFWIVDTIFLRMKSCTISNKAIALDIIASTVYLNNTVTGSDNTVGIRCGSGWGVAGGYVQKGGASIAGEEQKGYGGQIW